MAIKKWLKLFQKLYEIKVKHFSYENSMFLTRNYLSPKLQVNKLKRKHAQKKYIYLNTKNFNGKYLSGISFSGRRANQNNIKKKTFKFKKDKTITSEIHVLSMIFFLCSFLCIFIFFIYFICEFHLNIFFFRMALLFWLLKLKLQSFCVSVCFIFKTKKIIFVVVFLRWHVNFKIHIDKTIDFCFLFHANFCLNLFMMKRKKPKQM